MKKRNQETWIDVIYALGRRALGQGYYNNAEFYQKTGKVSYKCLVCV